MPLVPFLCTGFFIMFFPFIDFLAVIILSNGGALPGDLNAMSQNSF